MPDLFPLPDEPWMAHANCVGTDPEAFFPRHGESDRQARKICARCTVQTECLDYALRHAGVGLRGGDHPNVNDFGVFGGTSPNEREQIRRREAS